MLPQVPSPSAGPPCPTPKAGRWGCGLKELQLFHPQREEFFRLMKELLLQETKHCSESGFQQSLGLEARAPSPLSGTHPDLPATPSARCRGCFQPTSPCEKPLPHTKSQPEGGVLLALVQDPWPLSGFKLGLGLEPSCRARSWRRLGQRHILGEGSVWREGKWAASPPPALPASQASSDSLLQEAGSQEPLLTM